MARLLIESVEPPYNGLDTDTSPSELAKGYAPLIQNMLVDRDGVVPIRGPIRSHPALVVGTDELITGAWHYDDKVLIGCAMTSATATREPWVAPYRFASAANQLANPKTQMKRVSLRDHTVSNVAGNANNVISGRGARLGNKVYGFSYATDPNAHPAQLFGGGYQYARWLLAWDGTTTAPSLLTSAPRGGQDVIAHLNRLWVLGGIDTPGGGSNLEPAALYFTVPGGPVTNTASDWQDEVSGLVNKILVDSDDDDFGVGLARVGQDLVIFKRRSVHVLYGYSSDTFTLRPVSREIGCIDKRSIVEHEGAVYFMSEQGYMRFDGSGFENLSRNLKSSLQAAAQMAVGPEGMDGGFVTATPLPNDYILVCAGARSFSNGAPAGLSFCGLLYAPAGRWALFSSDVLANGMPTMGGRTSAGSYVCDGERVVRVDALTSPETVDEAERGIDVVPGKSASVPVSWWSRITNLAGPAHNCQLHRIMTDYVFQVEGADGSVGGWYVDLRDGDGQRLVEDEYQLPAQGSLSSFLYRRRDVTDTFRETSGDVQVRVEWREPQDGPVAVLRAEIHGVHIEFSPSRQRE